MIICCAWTNALGLLSLQGGPTAAVPAHQGAQCWEGPAAELCMMCWSSILAEQHVTQLKPVLMQH